ncbi:MAG: DNA polymerase III subunit beta, partial [Desulfobacterales bacterium]|nr:DNA polymerase III subunit beta [Desulfobacterales bacterium]
GEIVLSAYNARDHAEFRVKAKVEEPGDMVVVADKALPQLISSLAGQDLLLTDGKGGSVLNISTPAADYSVPSIPVAGWPEFPVPAGEVRHATLPLDAFFAASRKAGKAAANNEQKRPILNGLLMAFEEGNLRLAATDSYCLSVRNVPATGDAAGTGCVVHAKSLDTLIKMAKPFQDSGEVAVTLELDRRLCFEIPGRFRFATAVLGDQSKFPNIANAIPKQFAVDLLFDRRQMQAAYKRVSIFVGDTDMNPLVMRFEENGTAELLAENSASTVGTGREKLSASNVASFEQDEDYVVAMKVPMLSTGFGLVEGDVLRLRLSPMTGNQVVVFSEEGNGDELGDFYLAIASKMR